MVTIDPPVSPADPPPDASITELVKEAVEQARSLIRAEVALAKEEVRREIAAARRAAIEFGIGGVCALWGVVMLLVALVGVVPHGALAALIIGLGLLALAGILSGIGYASLPKKPLEETRVRLESDVQIVKENLV